MRRSPPTYYALVVTVFIQIKDAFRETIGWESIERATDFLDGRLFVKGQACRQPTSLLLAARGGLKLAR